MVEYLGHPAESFLRIGQRRIHGHQGVIELPQRLHAGTIRRVARLRRPPPAGKQSHFGHIKGR